VNFWHSLGAAQRVKQMQVQAFEEAARIFFFSYAVLICIGPSDQGFNQRKADRGTEIIEYELGD
jgi:hypothetical protein